MNEIELTEQFQTDAALIKRLKEDNKKLQMRIEINERYHVLKTTAIVNLKEDNNKLLKQLQQAIEKNLAIRLYLLRKGLGNLVDEIDEWNKEHEERIY